ncbi:MAG: DJ-1/PfpI family protein [Candidatus Competibacteraceae bacterium]
MSTVAPPIPPDPLKQTARIAVMVADGLSPFHLAVPWLVFGEDRAAIGAPGYEVRLCAEGDSAVHLSMGLQVETFGDLAELAGADLVIVPSWPDVSRPPGAGLMAALRDAHQRGVVLAGLCLGTYALAYAGLLNGRRVTTHWAWADDFRSRFPAVALDATVLYIDEGGIVTSAGTAAALDCCLHLLRRMRGAEISTAARRLVMAPHRPGGQAVHQQAGGHRTVERASGQGAGMGRAESGWSRTASIPGGEGGDEPAYLYSPFHQGNRHHGARAAAAPPARRRTALEQGDCLIDAIAGVAGFGSTASFRLHFTRAYQLSPRDYRRQFDGLELRADTGHDTQISPPHMGDLMSIIKGSSRCSEEPKPTSVP